MISFLHLNEINSEYKTRFRKAFDGFLDKGKYLLGEELQLFEEEFASHCKVKKCIGVDNGSNALFLALKVLDLQPNQEVIVAGNSYIATVMAIVNNGLKPVFVEPNEDTFNINANQIESKISAQTKAILITHLYGSCCNMDLINELANQYGLFVIDDCSHAHGATYKGKVVGGLCDLSAFSFYPTKNLGALGDAGAITTNNLEWAKKLSQLRNYGFEKKDIVSGPGYNARLDELQAAFLRIKLKDLVSKNNIRKSIAKKYLTEIHNPKIRLPIKDEGSTWHLFVVRTRERENLIKHLLNSNIETAIHYPLPVYKQKGFEHWNKDDLCITNQIHREVLSIPLHPKLKEGEVNQIINALNQFQ